MSQIHISKEVFEKLKESSQDSNTAMLMSKFNPERIEAPKYKDRRLTKTAQSLAAQLKEIRIKAGMEKPKRKKIKHVHVKGLGYSNRSVFRANDKDIWPYKK